MLVGHVIYHKVHSLPLLEPLYVKVKPNPIHLKLQLNLPVGGLVPIHFNRINDASC